MLKLKFTAASDRGLVRQNNEDSAYAGPHLLVMADGMGGHAAGEVASQLMVEHLEHLDQDPGDNDMLALLGAAAEDANASIADHAAAHPETEGMGTTLTAVMFNGAELGVCHVGDSRGYRLRDGALEQITKDDTFVQSLVDEGRLDPEDVSSHPQKSLILKAYTGREVEPTLFMLDAKPGDRLLLCSDGLSDPVTAATIESALRQGPIEDVAGVLVELALRSGGPDNVTVVLAEIVEAPADDAPASEPGKDRPAPGAPVTVGAIAGEAPEPTHPNSAASRAAALNRRPQIIEPLQRPTDADSEPSKLVSGTAVPADEAEDGGEGAVRDDERSSSSSRRGGPRWAILLPVLTILAVLAGGAFWARSYLNDNYYVQTVAEGAGDSGDAGGAKTDAITIQRGADLSVFGKQLHHTYQHACINAEGDLQLAGDTCAGDFAPFTVSDLPETERSVVPNLNSGSYDEVQTQLSRLSDKALPACRPAAEEQDKKDEAKPEENKPGDAAKANDYLNKPGVNCREVTHA